MNINKLKKIIQKANPEKWFKTQIGKIYVEQQPIHLADVLLALNKKHCNFAMTTTGHFIEHCGSNDEDMAHKITNVDWDLEDNNFDNQSDRLKRFLDKLLVK